MKRALMLLILLAGAQGARAEGPMKPASLGTQVTGQHETPLGLYIIPWRNADAAGGPGKPARLLDQALLPHDDEVFRREVEYHRALSERLESTGRITP